MLVRAEVADCCFARHIKHNRQVADMRDMTLLDTGYFIGPLVLSLVLPLIASLRAPRPLAFGRSCTKTVSLGQSLVGIAGIGVLASSLAALLAAIFGTLSCSICTVALLRQLRVATAERFESAQNNRRVS